MTEGFGVRPFDWSILERIGESYRSGLREYEQRELAKRLGTAVSTGDYAGASKAAFDAGETNTGLSLLKLGESARQSRLGEQASADFLRGLPGGSLSGGYGDDGNSGYGGRPAGGSSSRSLPTFAQGSDIGRYASAIQSNESGGNYGVVGPTHPRHGRALGAYQVMESNLPSWSQETLGRTVSPDEFLGSPQIQDAIFQKKFGQSVERYGNPQDAASVWFTGKPLAQGANARDALGTTGQRYVEKFTSALDRSQPGRTPDLPATTMEMPYGGASSPQSNQIASLDPRVGLPSATEPNASMRGPASTGSLSQASINSDQDVRARPASGLPVPTIGGAVGGATMQMPSAGRATQVAQTGAGSAVPDDVMVGTAAAGAIRSAPLGQRISYLERAILHPHLPKEMREGAQILLKEAYQQSQVPTDVQEWRIARAQGYQGTLLDWKRDAKRPGGPTILSPGQTVYDEATNTGRYTAPQKQEGQFLQSGGRVLFGDKATGLVDDVTPQGLPPTWRPLTPQERQSLGVRDDASVFMTPDGPKSISGQTINVGGPEKAQDAEVGKEYGKRLGEMNRAGVAASTTLNSITVMERAMNARNFYSGTGGPARLAFDRAMVSVGVKDPSKASPAEVFESFSNKLVLDGLGGSLGAAISNGDRDFIQRTAPTLSRTPDGNRQLLALARAMAQRQQDVARFARDYAKANGGRLDLGFDDALAEWAEKNPIMPGSRPALPGRQQSQAPNQGQQPVPRNNASPSGRQGAASAASRFGELTAKGMSEEQAFRQLQSEGY